MQSRTILEDVVALCEELLERMHQKNVGQFEMENTLYNMVAFKLFSYALNTFKSIFYLLPHMVYEQAWVLYRTLWETSVSLEWIALDPESRAQRFLGFTALEHCRFVKGRIRVARRKQNTTAVLELTHQLDTFEKVLERQLTELSFSDRRGRKRRLERFSAPTLQDVVREVGEPWLEEHDRDYQWACSYAHGAPSAVLFPLYDTADHQIDKARSMERAGKVGAKAIEVMSRTYRRWMAARVMEDDQFLRELLHRAREAARREGQPIGADQNQDDARS
jgi:hypothetical protein